MTLGGVAQMLAPKPKTPRTQTTDNGKQQTEHLFLLTG